MRLEGSDAVQAPCLKVWELLNKPEELAACTPGMMEFKSVAPDEYETVMSIGVTAIRGTYRGKLRITERQAPSRCALQVEGRGAGGFVRVTGVIELDDRGDETGVRWSGDVQVGGPLTAGSRMIPAVAQMLVGQFFQCLKRKLLLS